MVNVGAFLLDERFNLDLELEAAESEGEGKVISSPRVVTLDNRKASIEQGVSIPFQTFENGDAKLEFIDAVLRLDVTPHITQDKQHHHEDRGAAERAGRQRADADRFAGHREERGRDRDAGAGRPDARDRRHLRGALGRSAVARARTCTRSRSSGNAFKNNETREVRQELLVFVTPRIVVNPDLGS